MLLLNLANDPPTDSEGNPLPETVVNSYTNNKQETENTLNIVLNSFWKHHGAQK